jgi:hypothetical protein
MPFAALHESVLGTNRANRAGLMMSVHRGRPEVPPTTTNDASDPNETSQTALIAINPRYRRAFFLATYSSNQSSSRTSGAEIGPTWSPSSIISPVL